MARTAVIYGKGRDGKLAASGGDLILTYKPGAKHPCPMGGLFSTGPDVARFYRMLLNKGELDGKCILKPETVAASILPGACAAMSAGLIVSAILRHLFIERVILGDHRLQ